METTVIYVRRTDGAAAAERHEVRDLLAEGGRVSVTADTLVALREDGPFEPLAAAVERSGALRDALARGIRIPSLRGHRSTNVAVLALAALPLGMLLAQHRAPLAHRGGLGALAVDLVLVASVLYELSRRTPRMPIVAALSLAAIGLRWLGLASQICGRGAPPLVYVAAASSAAAVVTLAVRTPSRARVSLELLGKLGVTRSQLFAATEPPRASGALVAGAVACAAALPAAMHVAQRFGAGFIGQAAIAIALAAVAPTIVRSTLDQDLPRPRRAAPLEIFTGAAVGLALATAAVVGARLFLDVGTDLAQCVERLDPAVRAARAKEASEVARAVSAVRASAPLALLTVAVIPWAEERVYRGLLQDALVRKYGRAYGMFAAAIAFGVAHLGVYEVALYQTVLLGIGFGVAYAEGGVVAAIVAHAAWNALRLL